MLNVFSLRFEGLGSKLYAFANFYRQALEIQNLTAKGSLSIDYIVNICIAIGVCYANWSEIRLLSVNLNDLHGIAKMFEGPQFSVVRTDGPEHALRKNLNQILNTHIVVS